MLRNVVLLRRVPDFFLPPCANTFLFRYAISPPWNETWCLLCALGVSAHFYENEANKFFIRNWFKRLISTNNRDENRYAICRCFCLREAVFLSFLYHNSNWYKNVYRPTSMQINASFHSTMKRRRKEIFFNFACCYKYLSCLLNNPFPGRISVCLDRESRLRYFSLCIRLPTEQQQNALLCRVEKGEFRMGHWVTQHFLWVN